jgi:uncharacterized paraquat-inducible protein A
VRNVPAAAALLLTFGGLGARAWGPCGAGSDATVPMCVPGSTVRVSTTPAGVVLTVTSTHSATAAAIQEAAAEGAATAQSSSGPGAPACVAGHPKTDLYICPNGDYSGEDTADGRCPRCGKHLHAVQKGPAPFLGDRAPASQVQERVLRCPKGHFAGKKTKDGKCPICGAWLEESQ